MRNPSLAYIVLACAGASTVAASEPAPIVRAERRAGTITIDGRPDEEAWATTSAADGFRQSQPRDGAPASAATRFRVLWDDEALYFAIDCDEPDAPTIQIARRDRALEADAVTVTLDTQRDRRSGYRFTVYASGGQLDALLFDDTQIATEWDATWDSAIATTATGWAAEVKIPLGALRVPRGARELGLNVSRTRTSRREESSWRYTPRDTPGEISRLGTLVGLGGLEPTRAIELRPYVATTASVSRPHAGGLARPDAGLCSDVGVAGGATLRACAGLDFKVGLTSDLTLVGALNPDFGQVEADQHVLNLTTFETFFPEKRPFFQEGLDLFQPPVRMAGWGGEYGGDAVQLFYSRRIGAPLGLPATGDGEAIVLAPAAQPLLGAAKLVGQLGAASVAVLSAVVPRAHAQVRGQDGAIREVTVAEPAHAAALRARVPVGDHGLAGLTATSWDPLAGDAARHARVGALDLTLFDAARDWSLAVQLAGSHVDGGMTSAELDGTLVGDGATGTAASAKLSRDAGALTGFVDVDWISPRFAVNDLGFAPRANLFRSFAALTLRDVTSNRWWQRAQVTLSGREIRSSDLDGVLYRDVVLQPEVVLSSFWTAVMNLIVIPARGDDRELGDGTFLRQRGGWGALALVGTDPARPLSGSLGGVIYRRGPAAQGQVSLAATVRPAPWLEAQLELDYATTRDETRLVRGATTVPAAGAAPMPLDPTMATQMDRLYLLAPQSAQGVSALVRGSLALSPRLTLQLHAQLFTAGVSHGAPLRAVVAAGQRRLEIEDLQPALPEDAADPRGARQASLDVNLILRWEWRRGSTLYLVYAHDTAGAREPALGGRLSFADELAALSAGADHVDTFLVKMDVLSTL